MQEVITAISTVGFPIVSFLICAWFIKYSYDKSLDMYNKSMEKISTLADAVNHNTLVLTELVERLNKSEDIDN